MSLITHIETVAVVKSKDVFEELTDVGLDHIHLLQLRDLSLQTHSQNMVASFVLHVQSRLDFWKSTPQNLLGKTMGVLREANDLDVQWLIVQEA